MLLAGLALISFGYTIKEFSAYLESVKQRNSILVTKTVV